VERDDESAIKDKEDKPPPLNHPDDESVGSDIDDDNWVDIGTDKHEKMIECAYIHAEMAKMQRLLYVVLIHNARQHARLGLIHS
jgi:hypothetical protein